MNNSSPLQRYRQDIESGEFSFDQSQHDAVVHTQALYEALKEAGTGSPSNFLGSLFKFERKSRQQLHGLYLWGGVGRGKTWIIDTLYDCLPFDDKIRMHFNRFMRMVHGELKELHEVQDPLKALAIKIAGKARVICFDEFHVSDITDAMLLGGLLKELFERGIVLVTTSNQHPDKLYWDGLQRERFMPAIALLHQYTQVIHVDGGTDYRLRYLDKAEIYHYPLDQEAETMLLENFQHLAPDEGRQHQTIYIEHRQIQTVQCADGVVWFDFSAICEGPRGPGDYIEIGRLYQTVLIANVPQMDDSQNDAARRFITLVDEFYDRNVKLILSAASAAEHLYQGKRLAQSFKRTSSRLVEMQTHEYLARQHMTD